MSLTRTASSASANSVRVLPFGPLGRPGHLRRRFLPAFHQRRRFLPAFNQPPHHAIHHSTAVLGLHFATAAQLGPGRARQPQSCQTPPSKACRSQPSGPDPPLHPCPERCYPIIQWFPSPPPPSTTFENSFYSNTHQSSALTSVALKCS
jgi:hypothetical protein